MASEDIRGGGAKGIQADSLANTMHFNSRRTPTGGAGAGPAGDAREQTTLEREFEQKITIKRNEWVHFGDIGCSQKKRKPCAVWLILA